MNSHLRLGHTGGVQEIPADLGEALRGHEPARIAFEALPPERRAEWIDWVERARTRRGRRRRVGETVRRLGGWTPTLAAAADETVEQVPRRPPPPPPREWWPWLLLLLLLVVAGLLALFFATRDGNEVTVPRVVGLQERQAVERLNERGLLARVSRRPSSRPHGQVFGQDPPGGTKVDRGDRVQLAVSSAPPRVTVPDVVGLRADDAERRLVAAGLVPEERSVFARKKPGLVVAQEPGAGTKLRRAASVRIDISRGRGRTTVPAVVGDPRDTAVRKLRAAELTVAIAEVASAELAGTVVAQDPPAGERVAKGTRVRINVSTGAGGAPPPATTTTTTTVPATTTTAPRTTTVPDVTTQDQTSAIRQLLAAGLRPRVVYVVSQEPENTVVDQSPAPGASVRRGSRVRINVSAGAQPVFARVPGVVGRDERTARRILRQAGFTVAVFRVPGRSGVVVDQQPAAGEKAPERGQVNIFVGRG